MIHGVFKFFSPNLGVRYPFKFEKLAKVVVLIWPDSDMARLTFFPCEITQKLLFLVWGFHILATRKNVFVALGGGPNGPLGAFWLVLRQKMPILGQICIKIKIF